MISVRLPFDIGKVMTSSTLLLQCYREASNATENLLCLENV